MPEWALAVGAAVLVLVLAAAGSSLGAAIDARWAGGTAGSALLSPVAEAARLLRQARPGRNAARDGETALLGTVLVGTVLLAAALLLAAVLPLGALPGGLVVVAVLLAMLVGCARLLAQEPGTPRRTALVDAASVALPVVLALAGPAIAGRGLRLADAAAAQRDLWSAVAMPVALVVLLLSAAAAVPPAPAGLRTSAGAARLVAQAGLAAVPAVAAAVAVPLFLGGGAGPLLPPWLWVLVKALAVAVLLIAATRLLPAPRPAPIVRTFRRVVLVLVLVQLAVVALVGVA